MKEITLTLTVNEANLVLKALMNMPFRDVYEVIGKINEQSNAQLAAKSSGLPGAMNNGTMLQ